MLNCQSITRNRAWLPTTEEVHAYWAQVPLSIFCWAGVMFLEALQVLVVDAMHGYVLPLFHYIVWSVFSWCAWPLLTPAVIGLARRYPLTRSTWPRRIVLPHMVACFGCISIQANTTGVLGWTYTLSHELHQPLFAMIYEAVVKRSATGILAYWIIIAIAAFLHLREESRHRALRQAQLETRLASAELEMLRMQLHPHFLFNTLQAAITLMQEDPQAAEDVLLRLSQLLRVTLDQMGTNEVPLARELEFLDLYIGIQRRRFGDRLTFTIHAEPSTLNCSIPPLLLQPLVENAILHGIGKHKGEDTVRVFARIEAGGLQLEVWNENSVIEESGDRLFSRGLGLRNTQARLQQLYGAGASLMLRSRGARGAVALIFIPLRGSVPLSTKADQPIERAS